MFHLIQVPEVTTLDLGETTYETDFSSIYGQ